MAGTATTLGAHHGTGGVTDAHRIVAVRAVELGDESLQPDLQRITGLASRLLGAPVSLVTLIDDRRQQVPAQTGLREPWASAGEMPLSHSFCKHVVERDAPLVVEDARRDPLVSDSLAIDDLGFISYAGVPVYGHAGARLGALCAIDSAPRAWSPEDVDLLGDLATMASRLFELHGYRSGSPLRDALTGLPGRALFAEIVERGLRSAANLEIPAALVALDLDGFDLINEALGFAAGDALLAQVADRLSATLRPGDAVCRVAGDEFMVFCSAVGDEHNGYQLANRLARRIAEEPFRVAGRSQSMTAVVGVSVATAKATWAEVSDVARERLRSAKRGAEATDENVLPRARAEARLTMRNAVAQAHRRGEMSLVYQPLVGLRSGRLTGYEALLRWEHPALGTVRPDAFIPAAEESGAIVDIGEWVLEQACAELAAWRRLPGGHDLHLAVNVAPEQIGVAVFPQTVAAILDAAGLPPEALTLEVTERTLLADRSVHRATLGDLRDHGVQISLDDFGTGYSALGYLTRFKLDELKVDRSFIDRLRYDPQSVSIVEGIVAMARALGLRTVAEGIEEASQLELLERLGCDLGQGYHISRPIPPDEVRGQLTGRRPGAGS